jgi:ATP phosphoribosyltransferase regulatory subunit
MTFHNPSLPSSPAIFAGARDLSPLAVARKRWVEKKLHGVFEGWGYHRIITSTLESLEALAAVKEIDPENLMWLERDGGDTKWGLRPDLTAAIARASAGRMEKDRWERLYYNANIFRRAPAQHQGQQQEFYQAGVELLGSGGVVADAEILLLAADCLDTLQIPNWQIVIGEASLTRTLLAHFDPTIRDRIRNCIATLDRVALANLPLSDRDMELALQIVDLRGEPLSVLRQVETLDLDDNARQAATNLADLFELLQASNKRPLPILLDLSLIKPFDYYTGIVFEVIATGNDLNRIIGQGGRYDRLIGIYHPQKQQFPGIGFSVNVDDLQEVLATTDRLPQHTPITNCLVVPTNPTSRAAAFNYARQLRDRPGIRIELQLGDLSHDEIRSEASRRGISQIAWIKDGNSEPLIEDLG